MGALIAVAVLLFAVWHTTKHGIPRAMRALSAARAKSIKKWKADHPKAPALARHFALAGLTVSALRHGPNYLKTNIADAWREGRQLGRERFTVTPPPAEAPTDDTNTDNQSAAPPEPAPAVNGHQPGNVRTLRPRTTPTASATAPSAETTTGGVATMAVETSTGGEIVNAEQFLAEAKAVEKEAAADLEDATADGRRAEEDLARIDRMVASLSKVEAVAADLAAVAKLKDPAAARLTAARARQAAADQRLAGAKTVVAVAARHVDMIGRAAGRFYNR